MKSGCLFLLFVLSQFCLVIHGKVFTRCQLTRELMRNNFPRTFLSNWVCLVEQESERNTSFFTEKSSRRKYYGLFQVHRGEDLEKQNASLSVLQTEAEVYTGAVGTLNSLQTSVCLPIPNLDLADLEIGIEWCKEGRKGGKCNIACESLLDDDIKDDSVCAQKIFVKEGFKYWNRWEVRCKGQTLPDIEKCPDLAVPPPSRASPPRTKRSDIILDTVFGPNVMMHDSDSSDDIEN